MERRVGWGGGRGCIISVHLLPMTYKVQCINCTTHTHTTLSPFTYQLVLSARPHHHDHRSLELQVIPGLLFVLVSPFGVGVGGGVKVNHTHMYCKNMHLCIDVCLYMYICQPMGLL